MKLKGYVSRWSDQNGPDGRYLEYCFTSNPESAATWEAKEEADIDCRLFDRQNIRVPSIWGGYHICSGFKTEERRLGEFVVFCEAPFIPVSADARR